MLNDASFDGPDNITEALSIKMNINVNIWYKLVLINRLNMEIVNCVKFCRNEISLIQNHKF